MQLHNSGLTLWKMSALTANIAGHTAATCTPHAECFDVFVRTTNHMC